MAISGGRHEPAITKEVIRDTLSLMSNLRDRLPNQGEKERVDTAKDYFKTGLESSVASKSPRPIFQATEHPAASLEITERRLELAASHLERAVVGMQREDPTYALAQDIILKLRKFIPQGVRNYVAHQVAGIPTEHILNAELEEIFRSS